MMPPMRRLFARTALALGLVLAGIASAFAASPAFEAVLGGPGCGSCTGGSATVTTTHANDVIFVMTESDGGITVSSVSGAGLTWTKLKTNNTTVLNTDYELWYAVAASTLSSQTITITLSGSAPDFSSGIYAYSGATAAAPFDYAGSATNDATNNQGNPFGAVSTGNPDDIILSFVGSVSGSTALTAPTGFTHRNHTYWGGPAQDEADMQVSVPLTVQPYFWQTAESANVSFMVALTSDSNAVCKAVAGGYVCPTSGSFTIPSGVTTIQKVGAISGGGFGRTTPVGGSLPDQGGAGGNYCAASSISVIPGNVATINVGGPAEATSFVYGGTTYVLAPAGANAGAANSLTGSIGNCTIGGNGGTNTGGGGGGIGGGGAAGKNGVGAVGGATASNNGTGGGGADGGTAGGGGSPSAGGAGGNNAGATGGGAGGTSLSPNGVSGTAGGGGGGPYDATGVISGNGGSETVCAGYGPGGGGSGSGDNNGVPGNGALFGGGGGTTGTNNHLQAGNGAQGVIFIATTTGDLCGPVASSGFLPLLGVGH
jgi:hypothetical protein